MTRGNLTIWGREFKASYWNINARIL